MKLQLKLVLYNLFIKTIIIAFLAGLILIFLNKISITHLKQRIHNKRDKLIKNVSRQEISELLTAQSFTDYNILKEEFIILNEVNAKFPTGQRRGRFAREYKQIEGEYGEYLVLHDYFSFGGKHYSLEIGETMSTVQQLDKTILFFMMLILVISVLLTLATDLAFTHLLLSPLYLIIDQKLNKLDDPIKFIPTKIKTSTLDFQLLNDSINGLMTKINTQISIEKQFTSNISHELLTPLSILKNRLENILSDNSISENSQTKIVSSLKILNRLKATINSLLLISKVESNQYDKNDMVSLNDTINDVVAELEDRIETKNLSVENSINIHLSFKGNNALLHILFMNLINNAIKYNKTGGRIFIDTSKNESGYTVCIKDEGSGMSDEQIEKAFNRFEKLGSEEIESQGLGLAIVKSIISFHNINLNIHSIVNEGTCVNLFFPIKA